MPNIEVRGKYRTFRYDGNAPLDFTPYNNSIFLIRRPNPTTFVTLQQYVPGQGGAFTTFQPGSSYTMVTNADGSQDFNFDMGPYTRVDRLPSSTFIKTPNFYIGLDKNSIAVPISSYALSVNSPLSSVVNILYQNGQGNRLQYVATDSFRTGAPVNFTHFLPNSGYELRNRVPYTFFAPLQSEMGDAFAIGQNNSGEFGMGHRYSAFNPADLNSYFNTTLLAEQTFGIWDKIVNCNKNTLTTDSVVWENQTINSTSFAALSSNGTNKVIFVRGSNLNGKLGTGSTQQYYPLWTQIGGVWQDVALGDQHMIAINSSGHLYACGSNSSGQLGLGSGVASVNTLTLVDNTRTYVELAIFEETTVVRDSTGKIWGCGNNSYGQLGLNNRTSAIYTLTQESTNSIWTKVVVTGGATGALKNKQLFVTGKSTHYFGFGLSTSISTTFTQESLRLSDIEDVFVAGTGSLIRRTGQSFLFAAGSNGSNPTARVAALTGSTPLRYYTKTVIPSNITKLINSYNTVIGYIQGTDFYGRTGTNIFDLQSFKIFDVYPELPINNTIFLLSAANHFRPTPTPTLTPTPTVTPTVTPPPVRPSHIDVMVVGGGGGAGSSVLNVVRRGEGVYDQYYSPGGGGSGGGICLALNKPLSALYYTSVYVGPGNNPDDPNNPYIKNFPNPPIGSSQRPIRLHVGYGGLGGKYTTNPYDVLIDYRAPATGQNSRLYFINNGFDITAPNEINIFIGYGGNVGASYGAGESDYWNAPGPARNAYGSGGGGTIFGIYLPGGIGNTPKYSGFVIAPSNIVNNGGSGTELRSAGGGGGAGAPGQAGRSNGGGNGGDGYYTDFSGTYGYYAGGGGGGTGGTVSGPYLSKSSGGLGGGGGAANYVGTNGVFPGGGGGAGDPVWTPNIVGDFYGTGGDGGRGVVIIRYPINSGQRIASGAGNASYVEKDGYRIYVFSSNAIIYW